MKSIFPLAIALSLLACSDSKTGIQVRALEAHTDLNHSFIEDVVPLVLAKPTDLREIALTLPVFEVSPELRREWVFRSGIEHRTSRVIRYKSDGSCPSPAIRLIRRDEPIQIEVSYSTSGTPVRCCFERRTGGWLRLVRCANEGASSRIAASKIKVTYIRCGSTAEELDFDKLISNGSITAVAADGNPSSHR